MKKTMVARILGIAGALAASLSLALPGAAFAQDNVTLTSGVKVERVITDAGVERTVLEEPGRILPGDQLVFVTQYDNPGTELVEDFVVTNPLHPAVELSENGDFEVSVDGGANFAPLASLTVPADDGTARPAVPADVTHIRWTLASIAPGQAGELSFRARVK